MPSIESKVILDYLIVYLKSVTQFTALAKCLHLWSFLNLFIEDYKIVYGNPNTINVLSLEDGVRARWFFWCLQTDHACKVTLGVLDKNDRRLV